MQIKKPQHLHALRELLAGTRYLLCVDLEATCDEHPADLDVDGADTYDEVRHKLDDYLAPFTDNQHLTQFYLKERNLDYDSSV